MPPSADPDAELVRQAKAGEYAAFESLVGRHERRAYGLAFGILQSREDAEDAVQQAFVSVIGHLAGFREEAAFGTWLHRIVTNAALEILRKKSSRPTVPYVEEGTGEDGPLPFPETIAAWKATPEALAVQAETGRLVRDALAELPGTYRTVFVLRDMEGRSVAETAAALGITPGNVKVRLLRARLALRERLTGAFGGAAVVAGHRHPPTRNLFPDGASKTQGKPTT